MARPRQQAMSLVVSTLEIKAETLTYPYYNSRLVVLIWHLNEQTLSSKSEADGTHCPHLPNASILEDQSAGSHSCFCIQSLAMCHVAWCWPTHVMTFWLHVWLRKETLEHRRWLSFLGHLSWHLEPSILCTLGENPSLSYTPDSGSCFPIP